MTLKKKAIGLVTCDRPDFFQCCVSSIPEDIELLVINDGKYHPIFSRYNVIHNLKNKGVGASKNIALKFFYEKGYEHIFIIEDDIEILNKDVFDIYIKNALSNKIAHLNFGLSSRKNPILKKCNGLIFYKNPYAGFSYFHRKVMERVGYFDEKYFNALEHIDYTLRISIAKMHPLPPYYPDVEDSHLYLTNIKENFKGSVIRKELSAFQEMAF